MSESMASDLVMDRPFPSDFLVDQPWEDEDNLPAASPLMRVHLMDHTGAGFGDPWHAAALMIWTKRTRIEMSPGGLEEVKAWSEERKLEELRYMAATIPSSWEMCDFTFLLTNVTRAFTHQLVRTRTLSFAQQTMQTQDMSQGPGWGYFAGPSLRGSDRLLYRAAMEVIARTYSLLVRSPGVRTEDARGVLPTNVLTNIVMKGNLRVFCDLLRKRTSPRNTGEFPQVLRAVRSEMLKALPWTEVFLSREADRVAADLYAMLGEVGDQRLRTDLIKKVDQLMTNV